MAGGQERVCGEYLRGEAGGSVAVPGGEPGVGPGACCAYIRAAGCVRASSPTSHPFPASALSGAAAMACRVSAAGGSIDVGESDGEMYAVREKEVCALERQ